jgi:predicted transposase/invertase (TIGR01784 family)
MDYQAYIAESEAEGITKGIAEGKLETARTMLAKGFDTSLISEITNLSVSEIEALKL